MQIQKLKSSKLFYNKWPYKVECVQSGAARIIHGGVELTRQWCSAPANSDRFKYWNNANIDKAQLSKFIEVVVPYIENKEVGIRVEGANFNLFCKDQIILEDITTNLAPWIKKISGPETQEEYDYLIANGHKKILCDHLPKEKYRYRVYIKTSYPEDKRVNFLNWAVRFPDKIEIAGSTKKWLEGNQRWAMDPFIYVGDEKTLSIIGLQLSGYVRKVEEFILRDTVLTA
jgi:hypothetical protein